MSPPNYKRGKSFINMSFLKAFVVSLFIFIIAQEVFADFNFYSDLSGHSESMNFFVSAPTDKYAEAINKKAEKYYRYLLKKLKYGGMLRKKCRIYIYKHKDDYLKVFRDENIDLSWSAGVHFDKRYIGYPLICSYLQEDLLARILPHELTHAIFKEFVFGTRNEKYLSIPLWLDEGMAVYMQEKSDYKAITKTAIIEGDYIRLKDLFSLEIYPEDDKELVYFYAQAPSLVDFLLTKSSGDKFLSLAKNLTFSNESSEEVFTKVYYGAIKDIEHLQSLWIDYVKNNY